MKGSSVTAERSPGAVRSQAVLSPIGASGDRPSVGLTAPGFTLVVILTLEKAQADPTNQL